MVINGWLETIKLDITINFLVVESEIKFHHLLNVSLILILTIRYILKMQSFSLFTSSY